MAVKMSVSTGVVAKVVMVVVVVLGGVVRTQGENTQNPHIGQRSIRGMTTMREYRDIIDNVMSCPSRQDYALWLPQAFELGKSLCGSDRTTTSPCGRLTANSKPGFYQKAQRLKRNPVF